MIKDVEFPSQGAMLRGLLFLPEPQAKKPPVVIMTHGTTATITMVTDKYAESFCRAGMAVLLYDHRTFGRSEGEPRQEINPWVQCREYLDAIKFVENLEVFDPEKIALWGDSYTGGQVIVVGAVEQRVKVIVAQCPVIGAERLKIEPDKENFEIFKEILLHGDVRGSAETTIGPMRLSLPTRLVRRPCSNPSRHSAGSLIMAGGLVRAGSILSHGCYQRRRCHFIRRCVHRFSTRQRF